MNELAEPIVTLAGKRPEPGGELLPLVYQELRCLAAARLANEWGAQTLQPTALVHEAWLRLEGQGNGQWQNRAHFFAAAAEAMRRILIERARRKRALKRAGADETIDLNQVDVAVGSDEETLLRINEALEELAREHPVAAELVKLRFFVGLDYPRAAVELGMSERTAKRHWSFARAWLFRELSAPQGRADPLKPGKTALKDEPRRGVASGLPG